MMPDRKDEVAAIFARLPEALFAEIKGRRQFASEDHRRRALDYLCHDLNAIDGRDKWGKLLKPPPRGIPADVLVWRPTLDHVDALSDFGPMWKEHGRIDEDWEWIPADPIPGTAVPDPGTPPESPTLARKVQELEAELSQVRQRVTSAEAQIIQLQQDGTVPHHVHGYGWPTTGGPR